MRLVYFFNMVDLMRSCYILYQEIDLPHMMLEV